MTGYADLTEIAAPTNPSANVGRLYAKDSGGTTQLFFRDSAGIETNLITAGGSGMPVVRAASTGNVNEDADIDDGSTLDGVTLATGDLVLLKNQSASEENGIYTVPASGAAPRATEFASFDAHPGVIVWVMEGTQNADTLWYCTSDRGGVLGTNNLRFINAGKVVDQTSGGGFGPFEMSWGSNAHTAWPSFRMTEGTTQPTFYTGNIRMITPGDGVDLYTVTAAGTPTAPTVRTGAYAPIAIYPWPIDSTGGTTADQSDEAGIHTFGRNAQIRLFQTETPTQTARGGAFSIGWTRDGTRTPIDRIWGNGGTGGPHGVVFAGRAYEDSGIAYPYSISGLDTTDAFSPMAGINPVDYVPPGVVTILAPDLANGAALAIHKNNDVDEGFRWKYEHSSNELWMYRVVAGVETTLQRFGRASGFIDLGFMGASAPALRAQAITSQVDRVEVRGGDGTAHPQILVDGNTANADLRLKARGTGSVLADGFPLKVLSSAAGSLAELQSTEAGTGEGPSLDLYRNSASPANGDDLGAIRWYGKDAGGNKTEYGRLRCSILDTTDGSEDGRWEIQTTVAGSGPGQRVLISAGVYHPSVTGGDKGVNTINFGAVYDDNVLLTDYVFDKFRGINPKDYSARVQAKYDDLDPAMFEVENYAKFWRENGRLYGMPDLNDCINGIVKEHSLGAMIQKLMQTVELQAIHAAAQDARINELERRLASSA
jgi:hypothetical protein